MNRLFLFVAICLSFLSVSWAGSLSIPFHAGRLDNLERVTGARKFIQREAAIQQNRLLAKGEDDDLIEERSPDMDQVFVVLNIAVYPGRSLAPSDYLLQVDGIEYPCLGMAYSRNQVFDFRLLEEKGPAELMLIFACPASARGATMKCAYPEIPIPAISGLVLQEPEPEPEPEPETAPEPETEAAKVEEATETAAEK